MDDTGGPPITRGKIRIWPNPVSPVLKTDLFLYPVDLPGSYGSNPITSLSGITGGVISM